MNVKDRKKIEQDYSIICFLVFKRQSIKAKLSTVMAVENFCFFFYLIFETNHLERDQFYLENITGQCIGLAGTSLAVREHSASESF